MRRAFAAVVVVGLAGCNQVFGLDPPAGDDPTPHDAAGDGGGDDGGGGDPDASTTCGNDAMDQGEECDDGNQIPHDGCNAACRLEVSVGCSDGVRDGFRDLDAFPRLAACAGGWTVAGIEAPALASCGESGDDGPNPIGNGCAPGNLCAAGWHVCADRTELVLVLGMTACDAEVDGGFFATNQASSVAAGSTCGVGGTRGLFGCGSLGLGTDPVTCSPITRWSGGACTALGGEWTCTAGDERTTVVKEQPGGGGVLCCR